MEEHIAEKPVRPSTWDSNYMIRSDLPTTDLNAGHMGFACFAIGVACNLGSAWHYLLQFV